MATAQNIVEESLVDEEIDQIANEIAEEIENELAEASDESPDKPGSGGTGSAPESGAVTKTATPKGKKLTKKKIKAGAETKGQGQDPAEMEVFEQDDDDDDDDEEEENGNGKNGKKKKKKNPFAKKNGDDDEEEVEEQSLPETKQEMIRSVFETMKDADQDKLAGAYAKLMDTLLGESEEVSDEDEDTAIVVERTVITNADIDISEDLNAIFGDHSDSLSEEFKTQVQTVFEAAVVSKINSELDLMEKTFSTKLEESQDEILSALTEKVDSYLSYVVEEWTKENELAIERGIKAEITEEFIGGLKQLFEDHYIDIPEDKVDVVDSLADRVDQLETDLNESIEKNVGLSAEVKSFQKDEILGELSNELTDIEGEKLKGLSEGVGFEDPEQYKTALGTIRENYFPRTVTGQSAVIDEESEITEEAVETSSVSGPMAAYVNVLGRNNLEKR